MNEKVRKDQSMEIEDLKERSALLVQDSAMEDIDNSATIPDESAEVAVKVGSKRAFNEIEDLNSPLSEDDSKNKQIIAASDMEKSTMESDSKASSSTHQENNWLELAKAELGEVREENERLKKYISKMMKDYEALQMQFHQVMKQEETKKSTEENKETETPEELVSLSLGRFSSTTEPKKDEKNKGNFSQVMKEDEDEKFNERELSLALECKAESEANRSRVNSVEEVKEEAGETWQSKKPMQNGEDEVVQQNPLKKARVCVRARCDTPTMNDGCQWRKYGQKIAKGNPCPRAYYRCTVAASCPVRKQVQRCAEDMSILITTYEGTHNHPLPLSATAMASTTSAAAAMLLSGSSSSTSRATGLNPSALIQTTPADLHNLNFHLSDNSNPKSFYLQNSSISPSPSHPTITLDLTNPSPNPSNYTRFSSSSYSSVPKYAPSTLNFSSSPTELNWGNSFFSYGNTNSTSRAINIGRSQIENNIFQSYIQNKKTQTIPHQHDNSTISAATKAITADPSFQSALAAALSSIIGSGGGDSSKVKWGEQFLGASGGYCPPGLSKGTACATSYLNKTTVDLQSGSLMLLPTSLPFASPKSNASSSPGDSKDHNT